MSCDMRGEGLDIQSHRPQRPVFKSWYQTKTQDAEALGAGCLGSGWGAWWVFLASGSPGLPAWVSSAPEAGLGEEIETWAVAAVSQPRPDLLPIAPARSQLGI